MTPRIRKTYTQLEKTNLDALLVSSAANISYLTEFSSRDACAIISKQGNIYFTDARYSEEIKQHLKSFKLQEVKGPVFKAITDTCAALKLKRIGFEAAKLPYAHYQKLRQSCTKQTALIPTDNLIERSRQVKSPDEIEKIRKSTKITIAALNFVRKIIKNGIREIEVAAELERFIRYHGAYASAFDIIVASGPNSGFPHHLTSTRKIRKNEAVLIDIGTDYLGYKSDLTRVFFSGKINTFEQKIYAIVREAQKQAIQKIKPGIGTRDIDNAARMHIEQAGYGSFFSHSTGHGVGLETHEAPSISAKDTNKLACGMVFTVEPGIYVPNTCGIRIEDMVLVTEKGVEVLSVTLNQ
ncbi:MAG: Xaa-Pro peptidase family protein [Candidatus Omnitrophota bacterium]|jgi:Xaa-Pro aminopeptidase